MNSSLSKSEINACCDAVKNAGALLKQGFDAPDKHIQKKDGRELVTKYDFLSEELLTDFLSQFGYPVLGEEAGGNSPEGCYWVIDPLDGTNNFSFGIPHFCVTIALIDTEPVFGIVYDPLRDEMYHAIKNGGAFLNNIPLHVSTNSTMADGIYATGFSYTLSADNYNNLDNFGRVTLKARGTRRLGAAALDLAYVACGRFDGYWETGLKVWDMAAGALLVREAGGIVSRFDATAWQAHDTYIVSSNGFVHTELIGCLSPYDG